VNLSEAKCWNDPVWQTKNYANALNILYAEFYWYREQCGELTDPEKQPGGSSERQSLKQLVTNGLTTRDQKHFLECDSIALLADFSPPIMDMKKLVDGGYKTSGITEKLQREASLGHRQFTKAMEAWRHDPQDQQNVTQALKKLVEIFYVVRNNTMHAEKTSRGPDLEKAKRDRRVCRVVNPVIERFINILFEEPARRLAVYGTLAPGESNASELSEVDGTWSDGTVQGELNTVNGQSYFTWRNDAGKVNVQVFESKSLESHFDRIDNFEGPSYQRFLVPVDSGGKTQVCHIYGTHPDPFGDEEDA